MLPRTDRSVELAAGQIFTGTMKYARHCAAHMGSISYRGTRRKANTGSRCGDKRNTLYNM